MTRVIIHAGFHKTGTTTAQRFLLKNGEHIWPHYAIVAQHRIRDPLKMALAYSTGGGPLALEEFRSRFCDFLKTLSLGGNRGLIISAENLAGMMPGKNALVKGYSASPELMRAVVQCVETVIDPNPDMVFYFSTREKPEWLRSIWWHNLSKTRLKDDLETFSAALGATCDLDETVEKIRAAVGDYQVISKQLEQITKQQFGPATPLIDLLDLPVERRNALQNIASENVMPSLDLAAKFLKLNRSWARNSKLSLRKKALLEQATKID